MRPTILMTAATLCLIPEILPAQTDSAIQHPAPFTKAEQAMYMKAGEQASRLFFAGQADSLLAMTTAETAERFGGLEGMRKMMDQVAERGGVVLAVLDRKLTRRNATPQYWYEVEMSNYTAEPIVLRWLINPEGKIVGAGVSPRSQARADAEPGGDDSG